MTSTVVDDSIKIHIEIVCEPNISLRKNLIRSHEPNSGILFSWISWEIRGYRSLGIRGKSSYAVTVGQWMLRDVTEELGAFGGKSATCKLLSGHETCLWDA